MFGIIIISSGLRQLGDKQFEFAFGRLDTFLEASQIVNVMEQKSRTNRRSVRSKSSSTSSWRPAAVDRSKPQTLAYQEWLNLRRRLTKPEIMALKITWDRLIGKNKSATLQCIRNVFDRMKQRDVTVKHLFFKAAFICVFVDSSKNTTILTDADHAHVIFAYIHQAVDFLNDPANVDMPQAPSSLGKCHCHLQSIGMIANYWELFGEYLAKEITGPEQVRSYPKACRAWNIFIAALTDYLWNGFNTQSNRAHEVLFRRFAQRCKPRDEMANPSLVNPLTDLVKRATSQNHGELSFDTKADQRRKSAVNVPETAACPWYEASGAENAGHRKTATTKAPQDAEIVLELLRPNHNGLTQCHSNPTFSTADDEWLMPNPYPAQPHTSFQYHPAPVHTFVPYTQPTPSPRRLNLIDVTDEPWYIESSSEHNRFNHAEYAETSNGHQKKFDAIDAYTSLKSKAASMENLPQRKYDRPPLLKQSSVQGGSQESNDDYHNQYKSKRTIVAGPERPISRWRSLQGAENYQMGHNSLSPRFGSNSSSLSLHSYRDHGSDSSLFSFQNNREASRRNTERSGKNRKHFHLELPLSRASSTRSLIVDKLSPEFWEENSSFSKQNSPKRRVISQASFEFHDRHQKRSQIQ